ncbi:MAG: DUF3515 domain-containing protein, partial [Nocardioides sp.]
LLALAGCADEPVSIPSTEAGTGARRVCERFIADLPAELAGEPERTLANEGALGAAWGDPAMVLTCGGELPDDFDRFAQCVEANGVGWFVPDDAEADQSATAAVTAAGYRPVVQVTVPGDYRPEGVASVIAQLADPVREHLRLVDRCE